MHFWQEYHKSANVSSVNHSGRHIVSICLIIGVVNLDHFVKVVFARFLHCQVINVCVCVCVCVFSRYFVGDNSRLFKILFLVIHWPAKMCIHQ